MPVYSSHMSSSAGASVTGSLSVYGAATTGHSANNPPAMAITGSLAIQNNATLVSGSMVHLVSTSGDMIFEMDNNASNAANFKIENGAGNNRVDLVMNALSADTRITMKGQKVGIMDTSPSYTLDVTGDGQFTSNLTVGGNLTVSGTTTTISSTVTTIADPLMELNTGAGSNSNDLGFVFERGSTGDNACLIWDESEDGFAVGTTTATGTSTGNMSFSAAAFQSAALTATTGTFSGVLKTDDTTDATSTTDGSLQTDGGLSVAKDVIAGNDVKLLSDSAVLSLGAGSDATFTHDGTTGLTIAANPISIDSTGQLHLSATLGDIRLQDGGVDQIQFDLDGTAGEVIMKIMVDSDDFVFKQYDGTEVFRVEDNGAFDIAGGVGSSGVTVSAAGAVQAAGRITTDDATEATSTTDGSLQTDGGLSVAKSAVIGDDLDLLSDGAIINFGADKDIVLTHVADTGLTLESETASTPVFEIKNTNNGGTAGILKFNNTEGGNDGADGDDLGSIQFWGNDDGTPSAQQYAGILAEISDASSGAEGGKLSLQVAEHDGTVTTGLLLQDGDADGEIDVTLGAGSASVTSTAGNFTAGGIVKVGSAAGSGKDAFLYTAGTAAHVGLQWDADGNTEGTLIGGADDHGVDFKFFGETSGKYVQWDMSGDELVLASSSKLSFHDAAGDENIVASADGHLEVNAGTTLDMTAPTIDINASTEVTIDTDTATFGSANSKDPLVIIKNTTNDANGARLRFIKDKGAAGAADDDIGLIQFYGDDANQDQVEFARIRARVAVETNGQEGGQLDFQVASHDGEMNTGLRLKDGSAEDEIDVTIGKGADSVTTISGDITITGGIVQGSDATGDIYYNNASGVLTRLAVGSNDQVLTLASGLPSWADASGGGGGSFSQFYLEDDDGTEVTINNNKEIKIIGSGVTTNWTDTSTGNDGDPYDLTITVDAAQTGITSLLATDIKIGEDDQTKIDFETADEIHFYAANAEQVYVADGVFGPQTDSDVDLGTTGVRWKDAYIDTITTTGDIDCLGNIELGHASDTTIARASAGQITVEGTAVILAGAVTGITSLLATDIKIGEDDQTKIDFEDANKINFYANNSKEVELAENALSPGTSDGTALGTSSLMWSDLFLASGGVINFNNGDMTLTHSSNTLTAAGGTVATAALTTSTIVASGIVKTDDATDATSTTDGSLQTDGGLSVAKDAIIGNDVYLLSDGAALGLGADKDATFTHDGTTGLRIAANPITLDSAGAITLDSATGDIDFQDAGTSQLTLDMDGTGGAVVMQLKVNGDDFLFKQYDGTEVIRFTDGGHVEVKDNLSLKSDASVINFGTNSEITLTHEHNVGLILEGNGVTECPIFTLKNTNNDATGGTLKFLKDGGNVADNDVVGNITFVSEDDGDNAHTYASIVGSVSDMTGGAEGGILELKVAEHDGTVTTGLKLQDGNANGEIDVTVGAGADSLTTIAGDLDIPNGGFALGSDATGDIYYRNASGVLTRLAVGSNDQVLTLSSGLPSWEDASGGGLSGLGSTDNVLLRTNGTGGGTAQGSGIVVDDSNNVSAVGTLATTGAVTIAAAGGLAGLGAGGDEFSITESSDDITIATLISDKDMIFKVNDGGSATEVFRLDGDVSTLKVASGKKIEFGGSASYINGDGTDVQMVSTGNVNITSTVNEAASVYLRENAGTSGQVLIHADQGTGAAAATETDASIQLLSDAGGIGIYSGLNNENAISLEANAGANETIRIHSNQGTGVNAKGGSTDASIHLKSDVGGVGIYSGLNADNAITLEANGGTNETIQIRANQGTGVATADIANVVNASIALVSDLGGIGLGSGANIANAIRLEADGGTSEEIVIHSNQGTGKWKVGTDTSSIKLVSDVGGVSIDSPSLNVVHSFSTDALTNAFSTDGDTCGTIIKYSPGADDTLTLGQLYFFHTDGTWDSTDADATATGSKQMLGIGLGGSARTVGVLIKGFIRIPNTEILNVPGSNASPGLPLYVSTTAGHIDFTAPTGSGDFVRVIGFAIQDDTDVLIYFDPDSTYVEVA